MQEYLIFEETHTYNPLKELCENSKVSPSFPLTSPFVKKSDIEKADKVKDSLRKRLGLSSEDHLILTSSGDEAISQVLMSHYQTDMLPSGNQHIVVYALDHAPILQAAENLKKFGCSYTAIKPNAFGQITKDLLMKAITKRTSLVSLSWVHPITSCIQPIYEIASLCQEHNIALHLDVSYAIGKLLFRFDEIEPTYVTFDIPSIRGETGGVLLARKHTEIEPLVHGFMEQEGRASSVFLKDYFSLEKALDKSEENLEYANLEVPRLRDYFEKTLQEKFPEVKPLFHEIERLPHISVMCFPHARNEYLLYLLHEKKLLASIGGEKFQKLDSILQSLFFDEKEALSAISFALPLDITKDVIDRAINTIAACYEAASKVSSHLFKEDK